ncbi:MAG TPA: hypothetical protein VNN08_07270 [Thermoanaerobaculia bacterium]|nr:hypothetical protein [Thermoanaerobaculia bacterium]
MLDEGAGHPQIENERVLLIEKTQDWPGQAKALKDSAVVPEHVKTKASILLHFEPASKEECVEPNP